MYLCIYVYESRKMYVCTFAYRYDFCMYVYNNLICSDNYMIFFNFGIHLRCMYVNEYFLWMCVSLTCLVLMAGGSRCRLFEEFRSRDEGLFC